MTAQVRVGTDPDAKAVLVRLPEGVTLEVAPALAIDLGWALIDVAIRIGQ